MTVFYFFTWQLLVLYTWVGHGGLVLASTAGAALAFVLRQRAWTSLGNVERRDAAWVGRLVAGATGAMLALGLRVSGTTYDPTAPARVWEHGVAILASLGLVATTYALGSGLAAWMSTRFPKRPLAARTTGDPVMAALAAFFALKASVDRLRKAHSDATERARLVTDPMAAAEYKKVAEAIGGQLQLAEELQSASGVAVRRLALGSPVRRLLARRPDAVLKKLSERGTPGVAREQVDEARSVVRAFLHEVQFARRETERELSRAPGSICARLELPAATGTSSIDVALGQIETTYSRVGHHLEALTLRMEAASEAGAVADAAMSLTGEPPPPGIDLIEVALEMTQAEQSAAAALREAVAQPEKLAEVLVQASAALARGTSDDEALADVLRLVRRELEP